MADYIEREAAKKEFSINFGGVSHAVIANRLLDSIPAADVSPVVHGRWESFIDNDEFWGELEYYKCSSCGMPELTRNNYCPNCGAKMDWGG